MKPRTPMKATKILITSSRLPSFYILKHERLKDILDEIKWLQIFKSYANSWNISTPTKGKAWVKTSIVLFLVRGL